MATLKITDAIVEPVTLAEAKLHLRVDHNAEDTLITALITATRQAAEFRCQRTLLQTTWELTQDTFTDALRLQYPRIIAVASVKYLDDTGVLQTLADTEYLVDTDSEPGYVVPAYGKAWPGTLDQINAVKVRYTAGYGTTADKVPAPIKQWMLLHIGHYYRNREAGVGAGMQSLPYADGLLDEYRIWR
jgi:uncharacterized phiE125 gp8 family phage protein